jgi:hypothetical protein
MSFSCTGPISEVMPTTYIYIFLTSLCACFYVVCQLWLVGVRFEIKGLRRG